MFVRLPRVGEIFVERFRVNLGWCIERTTPKDVVITMGRVQGAMRGTG
jgi:hypothetical protein